MSTQHHRWPSSKLEQQGLSYSTSPPGDSSTSPEQPNKLYPAHKWTPPTPSSLSSTLGGGAGAPPSQPPPRPPRPSRDDPAYRKDLHNLNKLIKRHAANKHRHLRKPMTHSDRLQHQAIKLHMRARRANENTILYAIAWFLVSFFIGVFSESRRVNNKQVAQYFESNETLAPFVSKNIEIFCEFARSGKLPLYQGEEWQQILAMIADRFQRDDELVSMLQTPTNMSRLLDIIGQQSVRFQSTIQSKAPDSKPDHGVIDKCAELLSHLSSNYNDSATNGTLTKWMVSCAKSSQVPYTARIMIAGALSKMAERPENAVYLANAGAISLFSFYVNNSAVNYEVFLQSIYNVLQSLDDGAKDVDGTLKKLTNVSASEKKLIKTCLESPSYPPALPLATEKRLHEIGFVAIASLIYASIRGKSIKTGAITAACLSPIFMIADQYDAWFQKRLRRYDSPPLRAIIKGLYYSSYGIPFFGMNKWLPYWKGSAFAGVMSFCGVQAYKYQLFPSQEWYLKPPPIL